MRVPPYCGDFEVADVVGAVVAVVVAIVICVVGVVVILVVVVVVGVVFVPHDASTMAKTVKQITINHSVFFFIVNIPLHIICCGNVFLTISEEIIR